VTGKLPARRKQFDDLVKPIDRDKLRARAVTVLAILGGIWAIVSFVGWLWPDSGTTDSTPGNSNVPSSTLVTGFARDYVTTYLTAKAGDDQRLARFVTAKDLKLPPVASEFTDTDVVYAKQLTTTGDGVALWTVTVSGVVNGATTATPQRTYYRVPITVLDGAPRATALPAQVAGPGIGVDFRLGYTQTVALDSTLAQTAAGFVNSYLTGGRDFTRYVTTDSAEKPIDPAPYAKVDTIRVDSNAGGDGAGASTAEVYVTVAARTKNYTVTQLGYPLSLRSVEGRWQVVSVAVAPLLKTTPDAPSTNAPTTTTGTTPAPPPTRG
jgi:Conjugative transposon protein TcpC